MGGGELGEVLHEIPHTAFSDDTLGHAMRPPALLVKLWKLDTFRKPDGQVIVQRAAQLELSYPDVSERDAPTVTPPADGLKAVRNMARAPVVHTAIGKGDKPDVFPKALRPVYCMEVTACPNLSS